MLGGDDGITALGSGVRVTHVAAASGSTHGYYRPSFTGHTRHHQLTLPRRLCGGWKWSKCRHGCPASCSTRCRSLHVPSTAPSTSITTTWQVGLRLGGSDGESSICTRCSSAIQHLVAHVMLYLEFHICRGNTLTVGCYADDVLVLS